MLDTFVLSQKDGRPMYLQIIEQVKLRVVVGEWPPGTAMPSIREMAAALKISVITIKRAYQELERDGVIVTQRGKGSFVSSDPTINLNLQHDVLHLHLSGAIKISQFLGINKEQLVSLLEKNYQSYLTD